MVQSQVIGYNSLLVSQLQKEDNPDLVFTFELASWICQSFKYPQNQSIKISEISRQSCCSASLWAMASVAGCLLGSVLSDFLGRRKALMVGSFCQIQIQIQIHIQMQLQILGWVRSDFLGRRKALMVGSFLCLSINSYLK